MLVYSQDIGEKMQKFSSGTKAGENSLEGIDFSSAQDQIDEKYMEYIDLYTDSEDLTSWNEIAVLNRLASDDRFTPSEKDNVVKILAAGYYARNDYAITSTKGNLSECDKAYRKACRRAARNFVLALCVALAEPSPVAEMAAFALYSFEMSDAWNDYQDCINSI